MAYTQKENTASMFMNDKKQSENHPDWQGSALIDGREYYLSGWTKNGQKGTFFSISFKPKVEAGKSPDKPNTVYNVTNQAQKPTKFDEEEAPW